MSALDSRSGGIEIRSQFVGDIPKRSARRWAEKTAIIDGAMRMSFVEFDRRVDQVADALVGWGLSQGSTLAILSHNCWQYAAVVFGAARAGVTLVPINYMLGPDEIAYILDHSKADGMLTEDALVEVADAAIAMVSRPIAARGSINLSDVTVSGAWTDIGVWFDATSIGRTHRRLADEDAVRIMYTSGTEARPKGVVLNSRSLMWQYMSCIVSGQMESSDIEVHALPLYHCAQLDNFLCTDLFLGATSVILRRPDPEAIFRAVEAERATKLFCPPTVWISLLRHPSFDQSDLSSLKKGYYGASAMPADVLQELRARLPDLRLWNFYGQTEMASLATVLPPEEQEDFPSSAGRPALNVETVVVDDNDQVVPTGTVGEIAHRSPHLTSGYLDDPERTAEAFKNGWFHSGDLGYLDEDGRLYVVDRKKDMIKTGGENVSSREVEEVLYQHPDVVEAAVFGVPHPHWIEAIVAAVVLKDGSGTETDDLMLFCRQRLAGYKTPKYVKLAKNLPKNPSGKILKRDLRTLFEGTAQGGDDVTSNRPCLPMPLPGRGTR